MCVTVASVVSCSYAVLSPSSFISCGYPPGSRWVPLENSGLIASFFANWVARQFLQSLRFVFHRSFDTRKWLLDVINAPF
jgi:hypothetical protein